MAITKETISGTNIICEIESSNITKTDFNTESKKLKEQRNTKFGM